MRKFKDVDEYFASLETWQAELLRLREIMLDTGLTEALKWSIPNYHHGKKIVLGICGFKDHFGVWFHQGALLSDPQNVLSNAQEGKTKAMRQWRMKTKRDIKVRILKSYVNESIELIEQGVEIKSEPKGDVVVPPELSSVLLNNHLAHEKFKLFSPYKQREFAEYIQDAKRVETKQRRIEKILPMIVDGIGLNDKYRKN